jgi:predicted RNA-binding protein
MATSDRGRHAAGKHRKDRFRIKRVDTTSQIIGRRQMDTQIIRIDGKGGKSGILGKLFGKGKK